MRQATPRYRRIKQAIEREIRLGRWRVGERLPGQSAMARYFDVDADVVRRALDAMAEEGAVRREHRRGTFVASIDHGPDHTAGDAARRQLLLGVLLDGVPHDRSEMAPRLRTLVDSFERAAGQRGCRTRAISCPPAEPATTWPSRSDLNAMDGAMVAVGGSVVRDDDVLSHIETSRLAIVAAPYWGRRRVASLREDNEWAMARILELLRESGHRHIQFVRYGFHGEEHFSRWDWARIREAAFLHAAGLAGLEPPHPLVWRQDISSKLERGAELSGREQSQWVDDFASDWLNQSPRPTAAVVANDKLACGLRTAAVAAGLSVPGDLSIVGIDNTDDAAEADLTSLALPDAEMGAAAVDMLIDMAIHGGERHRHVTCRPTLVLRGSVAPSPVPAG